MSEKLEEVLMNEPVIAAIRSEEDLNKAIKSEAGIVFVLYGNINNIGIIYKKLREASKLVFIHVDMIDGLKGDQSGIEYVKSLGDDIGIITTKQSNIKYGKQLGLYTILRIFIVDSLSLRTGIKNLQAVMPDGVEVMPGAAYKIIKNIRKEVSIPIIAGGLIEDKKEIIEAMNAGAVAISTTEYNLWNV